MLIVDHHGAVLGIHVHTVDAPAERPASILNVKIVKGKLQVARSKRRQRLGFIGKHALQLRQDLGHLALLHRRERHQRALRASLAGVLSQRLVKDLAQQLLSTRQILGRHALHALLGQASMEVLQHVVDKVALLHVAKARVDRLGLDAIRHEPAQRASGIGLDLRGGRQARHKRRVLALAVTTAQDQIRHGLGTQMLRGFTGHALALETFACRGIEVPYDVALTHALRLVGVSGLSVVSCLIGVSGLSVVSCLVGVCGLSSVSGLGMRPQLGPHGSRIALARLAIVRHAGKRNRAACRLHRVAKARAQQGRGLKRHALATKARRQRGQRPLLV